MANRNGVFIGFYGPPELKKALQERARSEHRTLSAEAVLRLERSIKQDGPQGDDKSLADCQGRHGGIGTPAEPRRA